MRDVGQVGNLRPIVLFVGHPILAAAAFQRPLHPREKSVSGPRNLPRGPSFARVNAICLKLSKGDFRG
jgi:hypothetical protein